MARLTKDIRLKHFWKDKTGDFDDGDYNPKLYIKSDWEPPKASPELESALTNFGSSLFQQIQHNRSTCHRQHNLFASNRLLLRELKTNQDFIILPTDKNLGPAILERSIYKQRCLQDHLLDTKTYQPLPHWMADCTLYRATEQFKCLVKRYDEQLPEAEQTYFKRCFEESRRIPQFYCTPKVHKKPKWKTRPIVSCVNSRMGDLSKWVDVQLQRVVHLCPGYLKDSRSFLTKLQALDKLPPTAMILTADAVSMYTNINTEHALATLENWLTRHENDLPPGFPTQMVLEATKLVMHNNVFQFDDTFWLQLTGTAMGSNLAVMYATIYYSEKEETEVLPAMRDFLLLYGRLVDDSGIIVDTALFPAGVTTANFTDYLQDLMKFGDLEWEAEPLGKTANFLDLTIQLQADGSIKTTTFVKPMNLHLYIPPTSAHPPGVLKSLIFGNLNRFWIQNSDTTDYVATTSAFYGHLLNRGYAPDELKPLFLEAAACLDKRTSNPNKRPSPRTANNSIFIHWEYHPRDISRRAIRQTFHATLAPTLAESNLPSHPTIAYSVPRNIGHCVTRTQLREPTGQQVSTLIEQLDNDTSQPLSGP